MLFDFSEMLVEMISPEPDFLFCVACPWQDGGEFLRRDPLLSMRAIYSCGNNLRMNSATIADLKSLVDAGTGIPNIPGGEFIMISTKRRL